MSTLLDFDRERLTTGIIGLDEAGRGALAGPVSVGAVLLTRENYDFLKEQEVINEVKDSKLIPENRRYEIFDIIKNWAQAGALHYVSYLGSTEEIAALNITGSTVFAMNHCINKLLQNLPKSQHPAELELLATGSEVRILTDGKPFKGLNYPHEANIGGDNKSLAIALASIVAKCTRDLHMVNLAKNYPNYGLEVHKGYGTLKHRKALRELGPTPAHRAKFIEKILSE